MTQGGAEGKPRDPGMGAPPSPLSTQPQPPFQDRRACFVSSPQQGDVTHHLRPPASNLEALCRIRAYPDHLGGRVSGLSVHRLWDQRISSPGQGTADITAGVCLGFAIITQGFQSLPASGRLCCMVGVDYQVPMCTCWPTRTRPGLWHSLRCLEPRAQLYGFMRLTFICLFYHGGGFPPSPCPPFASPCSFCPALGYQGVQENLVIQS